MSKLQPVRGTHDILPEENRQRNHILSTARRIAEAYGYGEITPPVFEFSEVFLRTLGESSDVVTKETYTFTDRGGDSLTLRPEFTAGAARAFISGGLQNELPLKWYYYGPAFRYERPQKGRLRQFHQFGVENLGDAGPLADVEVIALAHDWLKALNITGVTLELNSLGDAESREQYRAQLVKYFTGHKAELSADSLLRLEKNPLRILDSKDEGDRKLIAGAPQMAQYFTPAAHARFAEIQDRLSDLGITYTLNLKLVRGLDYYSHTVFEFTTDALGAQNTVLAGGRYDGLVGMMGGPETPGVGWASGMERLLMLVKDYPAPPRPVACIPVSDGEQKAAFTLCQKLRSSGIYAEFCHRGNLGKSMKRANKVNARYAVILGGDELARNLAVVKDLDAGSQVEIAVNNLPAHFLEN